MHLGLWVTLTLLMGTTGALLSSLPPLHWLSGAIGLASMALLFRERRVRTVMLLGVVSCAAGVNGAVARERALAPPMVRWFRTTAGARANGPVVVRGVLAADARVNDAGVVAIVDVKAIDTADGRAAVRGRMRVTVVGGFGASRAADWVAGRPFEAPVTLREPALLANPGGPSEWWQRLHQDADLSGSVKSATLVNVRRGSWWSEAAASARRRVREVSARLVAPYSTQSAAIVTAILIGDRGGLAEDVQRRLRVAGTYHVIAISGGNVAILTALCLVVLRLLTRPPGAAELVTIGAVLVYGWIVGAEPSVSRAVVAAAIYLSASLAGMRPRAIDVLGATAFVVAAVDPAVVLDAGAWLSFGATIGIVIGAGRFLAWATGLVLSEVEGPALSGLHLVRRCWLAALGLFAATVCAELAIVPISAGVFARVSLLGLVLNFVAIPAMTIVQLAGLVAVATSGWADLVAAASARIAHLAASLLVSSSAADAAPPLVWRTPPAGLAWTVGYYVAIAFAVGLHGRPRLRRAAILATVLCGLGIVIAPGLETHGPQQGRMRVTMIDVGQGDAIVAQFPDGRSLLVDTGGTAGAFDLGGRVVTPALWGLGVRRLDWLLLTHPDLDHIGAAAALIEDLAPREIWEGVPVPQHAQMLALRRQAHETRAAWRRVERGQTIEIGSVTLDVLHPPPAEWERRRVRNEDSVVLRLRFGAVEWLLTGDSGAEFERGFATDAAEPALRLLKVGHHGSRSSTAEAFVRALAPQVALISVGRSNPFGHPSPEVLGRLRQADAVVFRTDVDGAVVMETDGRFVEVRAMRGRRWTLRAI